MPYARASVRHGAQVTVLKCGQSYRLLNTVVSLPLVPDSKSHSFNVSAVAASRAGAQSPSFNHDDGHRLGRFARRFRVRFVPVIPEPIITTSTASDGHEDR